MAAILCLAVLLPGLEAQYAAVSLGIMPFTDTKGKAVADDAAASELSAVLGRYRFIRLVERARLDELMNEIQLGMTGLVDEGSAVKAGKIRGLEVLVLGAVGPSGVSARAVHTETGRVIASYTVASALEMRTLGERIAFDIETHLSRENVKRLRNESPSIHTEFWMEKKSGGRLVSGNKNALRIGDSVTFHFKANRNGFLTIVDIQPGGDVVILFPNDFSRDNRVAAGTLYSIPSASDTFEITVSEPSGVDTVVAFFTEKKAEWLDPGKLEGSGFWTVKGTERLNATRGLTVTATSLKKEEWESSVIEIEVSR